MTGTKYCMGCMQRLTWDGRCQFCDYDEKTYAENSNYLPPHTSLKNGEYLLGRVLGEGGFGITYIGLDTALLQRVAIKEYFPAQLAMRTGEKAQWVSPSKPTYEKRFYKGLEAFQREGRDLARFGNLDGVVGVKTLFKENGTAYLVMDYVDGIGVKSYIEAFGVMEPEAVMEMVRQIVRDLQRIHEEHILHRDVSVDNLIIDRNGKMTLIDFGAAKNLMGIENQTETILCKQGYSALEQYSADGEQGAWTDVYGLCASMYYMLTGITPESAIERIVDDKMKPLPELLKGRGDVKFPEAVWRGMAVDRENRYQSMAEFYYAIYGEELTEVMPGKGRVEEQPVAKYTHIVRKNILSRTRMQRELLRVSRRRERSRRWRLLAVLAVVVTTLTGIGLSAWNQNQGRFADKVPATEKPQETLPPKAAEEAGGHPVVPKNPERTAQPSAVPRTSSPNKKTNGKGKPTVSAKPKKSQERTKPKSLKLPEKKPQKRTKKRALKLPEEKSQNSDVAGDLDSLK